MKEKWQVITEKVAMMNPVITLGGLVYSLPIDIKVMPTKRLKKCGDDFAGTAESIASNQKKLLRREGMPAKFLRRR